MCKEKPPISVVGDVGGRIAIMVCYEFLSAGFKFAVLVIKEEFLEITYLIFSRNKVEIKIIIDHFSAYKSKE